MIKYCSKWDEKYSKLEKDYIYWEILKKYRKWDENHNDWENLQLLRDFTESEMKSYSYWEILGN